MDNKEKTYEYNIAGYRTLLTTGEYEKYMEYYPEYRELSYCIG